MDRLNGAKKARFLAAGKLVRAFRLLRDERVGMNFVGREVLGNGAPASRAGDAGGAD